LFADERSVVIVSTVVTPRLTRAGVAERSSQKLDQYQCCKQFAAVTYDHSLFAKHSECS
jgi:hypothetical protein